MAGGNPLRKKKTVKPETQVDRDPEQRLPIQHVLLKIRSENGQTITDHVQVVARNGSAMFGKMGAPIGDEFVNRLNAQLQSGKQTFLFLTTREGWNGPYVTYRCLLRAVTKTLPRSSRELVPAYYRADADKIRTWFHICTIQKLTREEMNKIFAVHSGRPVMSVIASSATTFRVGVAS